MPRPQTPTPELVRQYIRQFDDGRDGIVDKALLELFRTFPENVRLDHILFKVLGLNSLNSTGNIAVTPVAKHIQALNIDARLADGDPSLVNEIALTSIKEGKNVRFYAFATKYCSWHVPDAYPMFDGIVGRLISEYQRVDKFAFFWKHDLTNDYLKFRQVVEAFRDQYGLTDFTFKDLDKFLWRYGKEYFGKSA